MLSESSLFTYPHKLVLKTCGTTALLRCLPLLMVLTKSYDMSLDWVGYSRKDFRYPEMQVTIDINRLQAIYAFDYLTNSFHVVYHYRFTPIAGSIYISISSPLHYYS